MMRNRKTILVLLGAIGLLTDGVPAFAQRAPAVIFNSVAQPKIAAAGNLPALPRQAKETRSVSVNIELLKTLALQDTIQLDPFPHLPFTGVVTHIDRRSSKQFTISGG